MQAWLIHHRARVASKSPLGEALAYIAKYWDGLKLFLSDGRVEIDSNSVERTYPADCPQSEECTLCRTRCRGRELATIASLVETCKLNAVDPAYRQRRSPPSSTVTSRVASMSFCRGIMRDPTCEQRPKIGRDIRSSGAVAASLLFPLSKANRVQIQSISSMNMIIFGATCRLALGWVLPLIPVG